MARVGGQSLRGRYCKHPVAGIAPNQRYRTADGEEDGLASAREMRLTEIMGRGCWVCKSTELIVDQRLDMRDGFVAVRFRVS